MSLKPKKKSDLSFRVAWSNESIELWFLLHFQDYVSNNGRRQYIEKLETLMDYSKTRAEKLYAEALERGITSPSAMVPATRMHELVEELEKYLG